MTKRLGWALAIVLLLTPAGATASSPGGRGEEAALAAAERDLCSKDVALIGENDAHGDGSGIAFKVALVRRLVSKCHFNAVFFEASHYDFLAFSRALRTGAPVSPEMVSSALGWMWNHDAEVVPLIPFLFAEAEAGWVTLGGLDDQLGARGAFYSLNEMLTELTAPLSTTRAAECRERLRQRAWFDYPAAAPHDEASRTRLGFASPTSWRPSVVKDRSQRDFHLELVANVARDIARDFEAPELYATGRDRSSVSQPPLARRAPASTQQDHRLGGQRPCHQERHRRCHVWPGPQSRLLDPSSLWRARIHPSILVRVGNVSLCQARHQARPRSVSGSVEAQALRDTDRDTLYLGPKQLGAMGALAGGIFEHHAVKADWAKIADGLVIFRNEHPVTRADE